MHADILETFAAFGDMSCGWVSSRLHVAQNIILHILSYIISPKDTT